MFGTFNPKRTVWHRPVGAVKFLIPAVGSVSAFVLACSVGAANPVVSDTGYEIIHTIVTPSLYWVNNTQLLFAGINRTEMEAAIAKKEPDRVARLKKLYLWDDTTKSVRLYADAQGACFSDGIIHYTMRVDKAVGKVIVREGPFGSEKEIEKPLPVLSDKERTEYVRSELACNSFKRSELVPPVSRYHYVVVLREGDGYLDIGSEDIKESQAFPRNLMLYQAKTGKAIQLPMTWDEEFSPFEIVYSSYRNAYVLRPRVPKGGPLGRIQPWPKDRPFVVYLLSADGRVETISIPYLPPGNLAQPSPIKAGWIFAGGNFYKSMGLYLFDGKNVSKLDAGAVSEIAITPDGCRAAVAIQNKHLEMGTPINLRIFNFCVGGR